MTSFFRFCIPTSRRTVAGIGWLFSLLVFPACAPKEKAAPEIKSIQLAHPLDPAWVDGGKTLYGAKCMPCHRLTGDRLVGPGWLGITKRRTPVWILNMICNTDKMLAEDAEAQKLLERCFVRMPTQNVSIEDARKILEFMRSNDGES